MSRSLRHDFSGVRPLYHARDQSVIGYSITGALRGPRAIATGRLIDARDAFHRLAQLPSLPRLRGELVVVFEEAFDDARSGLTREDLWRGAVDGSIYIAFQDSGRARGALRRKADRQAYWSVLRLCARLGMISGRGVPPEPDASSGAAPEEGRVARDSFGAPRRRLAMATGFA